MMLKPVLAAALTASFLMVGGCASKPDASGGLQAYAPQNGVNSYLWRATLETLDFMPLGQTDVYGGTINYDWYSNPQVPTERLKATVYILDSNLRADGLKVAIFKQTRAGTGWQDASVDADTARQIENSILTRARQLFIATEDAS